MLSTLISFVRQFLHLGISLQWMHGANAGHSRHLVTHLPNGGIAGGVVFMVGGAGLLLLMCSAFWLIQRVLGCDGLFLSWVSFVSFG